MFRPSFQAILGDIPDAARLWRETPFTTMILSMDLHSAFTQALPPRDWLLAARDGTLAGFFATDAWSSWTSNAFGMLDAEERARVQRKRRAVDRDLATLAYAFHRLTLSAVLECAPTDVPLGRDGRGCPVVDGSPLETSLSHAEGLVAVAVSRTGPVGIDIEPASRIRDMEEIAGRVCHPRELSELAALPRAERQRELLSLWVRKEALLKAAGVGMTVEMDRFEAPANRVLALPGEVRAGSAVIRLFDGAELFLAAVAAAPGPIASTWLMPPG